MFSLGKIVSDWEEPMKKLQRDDTFWGTLNRLGQGFSEAGADRIIGPSGNVSVIPTVGMAMGKAVDDLYKSKQAGEARKAGINGTVPAPAPVPQAPVAPVPTQVEQHQPVLTPQVMASPVPQTGPYALNIGPFSGATPDLGSGSVVAPIEPATDVPRQLVAQTLAQGPPTHTTNNPFAAAANADMGLLSVEEQNNVMKSIIDAAAQTTGGRLQNAQAEGLEAMNRDPVGYHASIERAKAMGTGEGNAISFANVVARASAEPVNNSIYKRLFPNAKNMGDIYRALGPDYVKQIGDLTSLTGQQANAAATEKQVLPLLTNIYMNRLKEVGDNMVKLAAKVTLPEGLPDTPDTRMKYMIVNGAKAFRTPDEQVMFTQLQTEQKQLQDGLNALEGQLIQNTGIPNRRNRQTTQPTQPSPTPTDVPKVAPPDPKKFTPNTMYKTPGGTKVPAMREGSWAWYEGKNGSLIRVYIKPTGAKDVI